ncbi:DUF6020 family protein [Bacillus carboniphilus]|uniref:DUF6020 family protein n=1 Tax=Bacillus carboniphilus TaxID=86663 RepID=A0ABY9JQJ3_9BACI|nr:DUF6020 family protein [Bacillus carboniphilus]WLR41676.1 DUF6020 family protein [Bacillus carboniphilus]
MIKYVREVVQKVSFEYSLTVILLIVTSFSVQLFYIPFHLWGAIGLLFLIVTAYTFLQKRINHLTVYNKIVIAGFTLFFIVSSSGHPAHHENLSLFMKVLILFGAFIYSYFILLFIFSLFLTRQSSNPHKEVKGSKILLYASPSLLVWTAFLLAFFPGVLTPDSFAQWGQAHGEPYNDWHPLMYTLFIKMMIQIIDSPATIAIVQILFMAFVFGYILYRFEKKGFSSKGLFIIAVILAILPMNGIHSITLWKDVFYNSFLFLFTFCLIEISLSKGKWLLNQKYLFLFIFSSFGLVFFRHNGFPVFVITILILLFTFRYYWKRIVIVAALTIGAHSLFTGPIFSLLDVTPSDPNEMLSIPTQQIAYVLVQDGEVTDSQLGYLNEILPIELWKEKYHPYLSDPIKFSKEYNRQAIFPNNLSTFIKTWSEICIQNPKLVTKAFLMQTSLVWQINEPDGLGKQTTYVNYVYKNDYGIVREPISLNLSKWLHAYLEATNQGVVRMALWRTSMHTFLFLFLTYVAIIRFGKRAIIVVLPTLLNTASVFVALPAQSYRYLYGTTLVTILLLLFLLSSKRDEKNVEIN